MGGVIHYFDISYAERFYSRQELLDDKEILKLNHGPKHGSQSQNMLGMFETVLMHQEEKRSNPLMIALKATHPKCMWLIIGKRNEQKDQQNTSR